MQYKFQRLKPLKDLNNRVTKGPNLVQVIMGPRQVGKTTAIKQYMETFEHPSIYATADLLSPPNITWIEEQWSNARKLAAKEGSALLVLDEVQKITRWSEGVKKFHDEDMTSGANIRVVILGSSALMVQKGLKESLAGRFEIIPFTHWSYEESQKAFDLTFEEYIFFGGYPGALSVYRESGGDEIRWQQYVRDSLIETVIGKDILLLTPVEKPALFRQVFLLACGYPAQILAYSKMLGQLHDAGNTTTIASYLNIMQAAGIVASLSKFSGSIVRQRASMPKLLILNNGLINATMVRLFSETVKNQTLMGRLVENAVGSHLYNNFHARGAEVFYWREGHDEIDYVVRRGEGIVGIEVKSGGSDKKRGRGAFEKRFSLAKTVTIGGPAGDISVESFLSQDPSIIFG